MRVYFELLYIQSKLLSTINLEDLDALDKKIGDDFIESTPEEGGEASQD